MTNKLYVGNLSYSLETDELKGAFSKWEVTDCVIIEGKGFGFVTFADSESAAQAKEELNNQELGGRAMKIDFAQERTKSGPRRNNSDNRGGGRRDFNKRY